MEQLQPLPMTASRTHGILMRPEHRILGSSDHLGWNSLYASHQVEQPYQDRFAANDDHLVIIHLSGPVFVERDLSGDRSKAKVQVGGMFLLPAGRDFGVRLDGALETIHLYIPDSYVRSAAAELCKGDPERLEIVPKLGSHDPLIEQLAKNCCQMVSEGQSSIYAEGLARLLASQLVRSHSSAANAAESNCRGLLPSQLNTIRDLVYEHLDEPLTIDDLAAAVKLNPIHFSRQFKRSTGKAPYQFIIESRVNRAKDLLHSGLSIAEIAVTVGFSHQEHLTRMFNRFYGMPPGAYRRSISH